MAWPAARTDPLLDRATRGDRAARAALLEQHGPRVYALCTRLSHQPDDAYQEIWARIFQRLDRFDPHGAASLQTWIATLAHRTLVDHHRRRAARGDPLPLGELPAQAPAVDEQLSARARAAQLDQALSRLPEGQRRVVVLHHIEGLSLDEIAREEGVAVGTVKSRLHRGRARLAQLLAPHRGAP
ncbi:MAG: RNA polymerase sigma factor [Alphaproteobacteria bacterium]|nr:RNA polymerase sigma factor [Alphaproteobacteria bacterium]